MLSTLTSEAKVSPKIVQMRNDLYNKQTVTVDDVNILTELIDSLEMEILEEMHSRKIAVKGRFPWNVKIETAF